VSLVVTALFSKSLLIFPSVMLRPSSLYGTRMIFSVSISRSPLLRLINRGMFPAMQFSSIVML